MTETIQKDDILKVYEIGYLLVPSVPAEKVIDIVSSLKEVLSKKGVKIISEENPELRTLSYSMVKKIASKNHKYDKAYFGWMKFEVASKEIEEIKKAFEIHPDMLRMLLITTVRDDTYLGKKVEEIIVPSENLSPESPTTETLPIPEMDIKITGNQNPSLLEDMDKSIDEMVKEA